MNEWMKNLKKHWKKITALVLVLALVFSSFRMLNQYHVAAGDMAEIEESGTGSDENAGTEQESENTETGENTENVENGDNGNYTGNAGNEDNTDNTAKPVETASADDNKEGEESASETENQNTTGTDNTGKNQTETTKTPDVVANTRAPEKKETVAQETKKPVETRKPRRVVRSMANEGNAIEQPAATQMPFPTTVDELNEYVVKKGEKKIYVTTYEDLWALQELSKVSSLDDYTFIFSTNSTTGKEWQLKNSSNFSGKTFEGLGSEMYPFCGTIEETAQGAGFHLGSNPFFRYLGSGAKIINMNIIAENSKAGMAETVLITNQKPITYKDVSIRGTVSNTNGVAGALYGEVISTLSEEYTLYQEAETINGITSVSGKFAGGYIGQITGNIKLIVSDGKNVASTVTAGTDGVAGGIVGLVSGGIVEVASDITIENTLGYTENTVNSCSGGLIGRCVNATVRSTASKVIKKNDVLGRILAGGYIGEAVNSDIEISNFELNGNVYAKKTTGGTYAGGVIGHYMKDDGQKGTLIISDIGVTSNSKIAAGDFNHKEDLGAGGIAGYIQGDNVTVSAIKATGDGNTFLPNLAYRADNEDRPTFISEVGKKGGIVGILEGKNITISNVKVAFSDTNPIGGYYTGYIAGYVNPKSKVKLDNITVERTYSNKMPKYIGGLMGYVKEGCIVALSGTIDLSQIVYQNTTDRGLGGTINRGYVAGYQTESLIYLEEGGTLKHNDAVENHTIGTEDYYNNDLKYLLDDLGNYGSVFHNIRDKNNQLVIQYDKKYGEEVTGEVSYSDSKYQLTEDADALRLAIALNTFDSSEEEWSLRFAKKCFQTDATEKTLLSASYQVTGDLNFQKTGIYSLCRNDNRKYAFTGNMEGNKNDGTYPTISFYMISKQKYGGLFTQVGSSTGTSSFKNLHLTGILYYAGSMGGIAPFAEGNITLDGITTDVEMRANSNNGGNDMNLGKVDCEELQYYSGIFGYYDLQSNKFSCNNCTIAPTIDNIRIQQVAGGLVGWLKTSKSTVSEDNIGISNITIQSKIKASKLFKNSTGYNTQARVSTMIAQICYDMNYYLGWDHTLGGSCKNNTYAKMQLNGVTVSDASIDMSLVEERKNEVRATGGFLGYEWDNVEVSAGAIKVQNNSVIKSLGRVGGLITTFAGKLDFNGEVSLESMEMEDCVSEKNSKFSSLLVADGRNAVITIIDKDYSINENNVKVTGYSNFDELVGVNLELKNNSINPANSELQGDYKSGGILNIIKPEFADITVGQYNSYRNKVIPQTNKYTRYYYNLFGENYDDKKITFSNGIAGIDSSEKLMLWHLYKYSTSSIKRFITNYYVDSDGNTVTKYSEDNDGCIVAGGTNIWNWKLQNILNMKGYSFYPSPTGNGMYYAEGATLILYGEELENLETTANKRKPGDSTQQHYMMHGGMFSGVTGNIEISGLTLQGTAANLGERSGALVAGNVASGTMTVKNVACDGIRIANYASTQERAVALLISNVSDKATLNMKGITTTAYDSLDENSYTAAALIGTVGSENATNVRVTFKEMKVEDDRDKVFEYASFIYSYNYSNDSNSNKSTGIYTFTKSEFSNEIVTFGAELSYGVEYSDDVADDELKKVISNAAITYIPYVYTGKNIWVNPKTGDLTEGCGTYEDPYVISNTRQFLSLYCYLTSTNSSNSYTGAYQDMFPTQATDSNVWKVNVIKGGTTSDRCNKESANHQLVSYGNKDNNFPTVDQMRKAYYVITTDLNLTKHSDLNEYILEKDFAGLGTKQNPFSGVLIGQKKETNGSDITRATIILPKQENDTEWNTYGLVKYMKGAVVKNLDIQIPKTDATYTDNKINIQQNGIGGGVAAVVLGGDNIIDNVSVDIQFVLPTSNTGTIRTGGYVGIVKKGSVIIREMEKTNVEKYRAYHKQKINDITSFYPITYTDYPNNCRVIGMVEDGCVICEGTFAEANKEKKVLEQADLGFDAETDGDIPLSCSFPLVNGAYLEDDCQGGIKVENSSEGYTINLKNEAQLEIAALALNSDAFAIYNSGTVDIEHANGYDYTAICRKAEYNDVGKVENNQDDYQNAINNDDNIGYYPYLCWKYMNFDDFTNYTSDGIQKVYEETIKNVTYNRRLSKLNWVNGTTEVTTYQLVTDQTYDMTDYGRSFRGFGGLYQPEYSQFQANFDGKGATVIIDMVRDWDSDIQATGMFNDLTTYRAGGFTIQNIHLLNSRFDSSKTKASSTGALAGNVKGEWNFKDISFEVNENATTATQGAIYSSQYLGGLVGCIQYYSTSSGDADKQKISFNNCKVMGTNEKKCEFSSVFYNGGSGSLEGNSGGLVGYVEGRTNDTITYFGNISFQDCAVRHCNIGIQSNKKGNLGGFIGRVGNSNNDSFTHDSGRSIGDVSIKQTVSTMTTVEDIAISSETAYESSVGGLIGEYCSYNNNPVTLLEISGVRLTGLRFVDVKSKWSNKYGVGGLVGGIWVSKVNISDVEVTDSTIGTTTLSTGGLLGAAYTDYANINGAKVSGCCIETRGNNSAFAGGFIGDSQITNELTIGTDTTGKGNEVKNTTIQSKYWSAGGVIGSNSQNNKNWNLSDIQVDNTKIYSGTKDEGGDITVEKYNVNNTAGGIFGRTTNGLSVLDMSNIYIINGTEIVGYSVGGLVGTLVNGSVTLKGNVFVGCSSGAAISDRQVSCVSGVSIYGVLRVGGLYGYNLTQGTVKSTADIRIYHTKIGGYSNNSSIPAQVGGVAGVCQTYNLERKYDKLDIKECLIVANNSGIKNQISVGGIYGNMIGSSRCYYYQPRLTDNSIGYLNSLNNLNVLKKTDYTSKEVKLLKNGTDVKGWLEIEGGITAKNVGDYSIKIGNYLGQRGGDSNIYILRPKLKYSSDFTGSRPAIDVGNASVGIQGDSNDNTDKKYGYGYPYEWRQWCHIINFEPGETTEHPNPVDVDMIQSIENSKSENEYLYNSVDDIMDTYQSAVSGSAFLDAYRLNVNMKDPIEGDKYKILDYYNKFVKEKEVNGVRVVYADGGTAQSIMDSVMGILTNAGGIRGGDTNSTKYMSISVTPAVVINGEIKKSSKTNASLKVDKKNNTFEYFSNYYDEELEDGSCTISLVTIRYGWEGADTQGKYETIYIPVFVVERIDFYNNIHIMEGEQYSLEYAHSDKSYSGYVTVAHDSTYTLFVEMAYGNGRTKPSYKDYALNKTLKFEWNSPNKVLQKGVKLTLVDVLTQKPYYYEVTEPTSSIDFSNFKDADGNPYEDHTVSTINNIAEFEYAGQKFTEQDNFGIEQFYIHVDCSDVKEKINNVFQVTVNTDSTNPTQLSFFNRTETQKVEILSIPGLEIQFLDEETKVSGEISKDGSIHIDTGIEIKAGLKDLYWIHKNQSDSVFIDSQNNNKYLDVAITLIDNETGKPVTLPANTNIIVSGGAVASVGQSVIYTYKDWGNKFSLGSITKDITTGPSLITQEDGTKVSNECHIELDFSVADIDQYVSGDGKSYTIQLELRRTSNPDYPLGGDMLDFLTVNVTGKGSKEMAVALDVDKTMDLGINTYRQTQTTYTIPFKSKLDFSGMISKLENATSDNPDVKLCADKNYLITYRIKKKVKNSDGTYEYVPVEKEDIPESMKIGDKLKLRFQDGTGNMNEEVAVLYQKEMVYQVVKEFTADQIATGTDGIKCMLTWDYELVVDTTGISPTDYSNYKVEMTVLPYDKTDSEGNNVTNRPNSDSESKLVDYFIFTLGKLKTDR